MDNISIHPDHRHDPHYRYQMESLRIHYQGKNQNIRTFIDNLDKVCDKIGRSINSILKFFVLSLKTRQVNGALRGQYEQPRLQKIVDNFIRHYVLCDCGSPETRIVIEYSKPGYDCRACGKRRRLADDGMKNTLLKEARTIVSPLEKLDFSGIDDKAIRWSVSTSPRSVAKRRAEHQHRTPEILALDLLKRGDLKGFREFVTEQEWDTQKLVEIIVEQGFTYRLIDHLQDYSRVLKSMDKEFQLLFTTKFKEWTQYHYPERDYHAIELEMRRLGIGL